MGNLCFNNPTKSVVDVDKKPREQLTSSQASTLSYSSTEKKVLTLKDLAVASTLSFESMEKDSNKIQTVDDLAEKLPVDFQRAGCMVNRKPVATITHKGALVKTLSNWRMIRVTTCNGEKAILKVSGNGISKKGAIDDLIAFLKNSAGRYLNPGEQAHRGFYITSFSKNKIVEVSF